MKQSSDKQKGLRQDRAAKTAAGPNGIAINPPTYGMDSIDLGLVKTETGFGDGFLSGDCIIQPRLVVGSPDDSYEREADRVAEQVMRMPGPCPTCGGDEKLQTTLLTDRLTPSVQRQEDEGEEEEGEEEPVQTELTEDIPIPPQAEPEEEDEPIQTKGNGGQTPQVGPDLAAQIHSLRGGGQPLPQPVRDFFEARFERDFSRVRLHNDADASATAKSLNARAFTVGENVVLGSQQDALETGQGNELLAHELAHVVQQGRAAPLKPERRIEPIQRITLTGAVQLKPKSTPAAYRRYQKRRGKLKFPEWNRRYGPAAMRQHHLVPQEAIKDPAIRARLKSQRINIHELTILIDYKTHSRIHIEKWNAESLAWLRTHKNFTRKQLFAQLSKMSADYGIPKRYWTRMPKYGRQHTRGPRFYAERRKRVPAKPAAASPTPAPAPKPASAPTEPASVSKPAGTPPEPAPTPKPASTPLKAPAESGGTPAQTAAASKPAGAPTEVTAQSGSTASKAPVQEAVGPAAGGGTGRGTGRGAAIRGAAIGVGTGAVLAGADILISRLEAEERQEAMDRDVERIKMDIESHSPGILDRLVRYAAQAAKFQGQHPGQKAFFNIVIRSWIQSNGPAGPGEPVVTGYNGTWIWDIRVGPEDPRKQWSEMESQIWPPGMSEYFFVNVALPYDSVRQELQAAEESGRWAQSASEIRAWLEAVDPAVIGKLPIQEKIRFINILLTGWIRDDDIKAVETICRSVHESAEISQIRKAVEPQLLGMTSLGQRTWMRGILAGMQ